MPYFLHAAGSAPTGWDHGASRRYAKQLPHFTNKERLRFDSDGPYLSFLDATTPQRSACCWNSRPAVRGALVAMCKLGTTASRCAAGPALLNARPLGISKSCKEEDDPASSSAFRNARRDRPSFHAPAHSRNALSDVLMCWHGPCFRLFLQAPLTQRPKWEPSSGMEPPGTPDVAVSRLGDVSVLHCSVHGNGGNAFHCPGAPVAAFHEVSSSHIIMPVSHHAGS